MAQGGLKWTVDAVGCSGLQASAVHVPGGWPSRGGRLVLLLLIPCNASVGGSTEQRERNSAGSEWVVAVGAERVAVGDTLGPGRVGDT